MGGGGGGGRETVFDSSYPTNLGRSLCQCQIRDLKNAVDYVCQQNTNWLCHHYPTYYII